jgi:hypothetical protein
MKLENQTLENQAPENQTRIFRAVAVGSLIMLAAVLRVLPHPWNFTPIGAMALFSGSLFRNRWPAFLLPLVSLFAGDIFVGFHKLMLFVYASFAASVAIGRCVGENRSVARIGGAVLAGASQFFVVTNFAMWATGGFYPRTSAGLLACYAAGLPYFWNTFAGDALYAGLLFGAYALAERTFAHFRGHSWEPAGE